MKNNSRKNNLKECEINVLPMDTLMLVTQLHSAWAFLIYCDGYRISNSYIFSCIFDVFLLQRAPIGR